MRIVDADLLIKYVKDNYIGEGCNGNHQKEFIDAINELAGGDYVRAVTPCYVHDATPCEEDLKASKDIEELYNNALEAIRSYAANNGHDAPSFFVTSCEDCQEFDCFGCEYKEAKEHHE